MFCDSVSHQLFSGHTKQQSLIDCLSGFLISEDFFFFSPFNEKKIVGYTISSLSLNMEMGLILPLGLSNQRIMSVVRLMVMSCMVTGLLK